jgi:hypothetical protein
MRRWHTSNALAATARNSAAFADAVQNAVEKLFGLWGQPRAFCTGIFRRAAIGDCRRRRLRPAFRHARARTPRRRAGQHRERPLEVPTGSSARRDRSDDATWLHDRRRRRAPGLPNGARRRRRAQSCRYGWVPAGHRLVARNPGYSPATGRGPTGPSIGAGARPGAGSTGRRLPRPSTGGENPARFRDQFPWAAARRGRRLRARPRQRFGVAVNPPDP